MKNPQKDKTLYNLRKPLAICALIVYNNTRQNKLAENGINKEGNRYEQGKHQEGRSRIFGRP